MTGSRSKSVNWIYREGECPRYVTKILVNNRTALFRECVHIEEATAKHSGQHNEEWRDKHQRPNCVKNRTESWQIHRYILELFSRTCVFSFDFNSWLSPNKLPINLDFFSPNSLQIDFNSFFPSYLHFQFQSSERKNTNWIISSQIKEMDYLSTINNYSISIEIHAKNDCWWWTGRKNIFTLLNVWYKQK